MRNAFYFSFKLDRQVIMKVLAICGSIRAQEGNNDLILELAHSKGDINDFIDNANRLTDGRPILANSEIMAAAGMMGARQRGAEVEYLGLAGLFEKKEETVFDLDLEEAEPYTYLDTLTIPDESMKTLVGEIEEADGIILATPVYFGDRSSVANKLLQVTALRGLLKNKIFGVVSVGAKRNGGQETANIYSMVEALNQGALAVGNGPPTSQYGGTGVGGHKGHVLEDAWGLQTAHGTGTKVAHVSEIFQKGRGYEKDQPVTLSILVTMDTDNRFLARYLRKLTAAVKQAVPSVEFDIHEVIDATIYRCLGCSTCPIIPSGQKAKPKCVIKDPEDYVEVIRNSLINCDGVLIAGLNTLDVQNLIFRYQVLTERMRYIRRNNFELTDLLIAGLCYHQFGATVNSIHPLKVLTSYIRQNTTVHRPVEILEYKGKLLEDGLTALKDFCITAQRIKHGKQFVAHPVSVYETGGLGGGYKKTSPAKGVTL